MRWGSELTSPLLDYCLGNPYLVGATFIAFIYLDVKLTRRGFSLYQQKYSQHVKTPSYELNPLHQEAIQNQTPLRKRTWIAFFFLLLVTFYMSLDYQVQENTEINELFLGVLFWFYLSIILTHIENILLFLYINKNPDEIKGELITSVKFSYGTAKNKGWNIGLLCLVVFVLLKEMFFLGGFLGSVLKFLVLSWWGSKISKKDRKREGNLVIQENQQKEDKEVTSYPTSQFCPRCNRELLKNAKFCAFCGFSLNERLICHSCQREIPAETKFCIYCGVQQE